MKFKVANFLNKVSIIPNPIRTKMGKYQLLFEKWSFDFLLSVKNIAVNPMINPIIFK